MPTILKAYLLKSNSNAARAKERDAYRKVPDADGTRFTAHDQRRAVWEEFAGPDVVLLEAAKFGSRGPAVRRRLPNIPHLDASSSTCIDVPILLGNRHSANDVSMWKVRDSLRFSKAMR